MTARLTRLGSIGGAVRRSAALTVLLLAFAGVATLHAIVGGEPDGRRHPFVGLVAYQLEANGPWYVPPGGSAILVSPTVAITAGHVLETPLTRIFLGVEPYRRGVVFDPKPVDVTAPFAIGPFREVPASSVHVAKSVAWHPDLHASPDTPNDIGVMVFEHAVRGRPMAWVARPGFFDWLTRVFDPRIEIVGYGATAFGLPPSGGGNRRSGTASFIDSTSEVLLTGVLESGDVSAAPGDSGSPALVANNIVVGVFSDFVPNPDPAQPPYSRFNRTDSESSCRFLSTYLTMRCQKRGD